MAQAAFEFSPVAGAPTRAAAAVCRLPQPGQGGPADGPAGPGAADRIGFAIGWDHARHRVIPPLAHLDAHNPVGQGWTAGRAAFGTRRLRAGAAVRQWLALRLQAWQQGADFEDQQVNPAFLARIDATHCPVTRQPLLLCSDQPGDATVQRLNPAAAYAAGNLACISRQAAQAWQALDAAPHWQAAQQQADRLADAAPGAMPAEAGSLSAEAWQRLAVLASLATPLPHAQAAALPLRVLPPNRVRVINPVQALQVMLTLQFTQGGYARRLLGLAALVPGSEARQAFQIFMHTLLARRLQVGPSPDPLALRHALEDTWADTLVQRRWQRLASRLSAADCEQLLQRASQRGLMVGGGRWLSAERATDGWSLDLPAPAGAEAVRSRTR